MDCSCENVGLAYLGKRALITGGLGFIGSNLANKLVGCGATVTVVDCLAPEQGGNLFNIQTIADSIRIELCDIRDRSAMEKLMKNQDYIFSLAAQTSHIDSMRYPINDLEVNCNGHLTILEACRENNPAVKIVFASTRQIYGKPDYLPLDETHPLRPPDINGIHKVAGELYHQLYKQVYGMHISVLRLTNTYGPRQIMKHNRGGFAGWFIRQAIDNETIMIFGDGSQLRDFNYVDDVVDAFLLTATSDAADGEVFNLGSDGMFSLVEFADRLTKVAQSGRYELVPFPQDRKQIDIGSAYCSIEKIRKALGWSPKVSLEEGLKRSVEFCRRNKSHYWD